MVVDQDLWVKGLICSKKSYCGLLIMDNNMKKDIKIKKKPQLIKVDTEQFSGPDEEFMQYEWFAKVNTDFQQKIQEKVVTIESLTKRGEQQRCFDHNIPYSLYCTHCRKVICASCMYNFTSHKKHKVIPLDNSSKEIKEDIEIMISKLETKLKVCERLVDDSNFKIMMYHRSYEKANIELNRFYDNLFEQLKKKREQQIKDIQQSQEDTNKQLKAYHRALSKISIYTNEKFRTYANPNLKFELLVPARGIVEVLNLNLTNIQWLEMDFEKLKFELDTQKLKDIEKDLMLRIDHLEKPTILIDIKKLNKKASPTKAVSNRSLSPNKKFPSTPRKQKMHNYSIAASPRSVRKWQFN